MTNNWLVVKITKLTLTVPEPKSCQGEGLISSRIASASCEHKKMHMHRWKDQHIFICLSFKKSDPTMQLFLEPFFSDAANLNL